MKQILQNLGSGETLLAEVPAPLARAGHLLIRTEASLVSLGTEKMLVAFGQANLLEKARQQPEKVKQVLQKIRTDGLFATVGAIRAKLDKPLPRLNPPANGVGRTPGQGTRPTTSKPAL